MPAGAGRAGGAARPHRQLARGRLLGQRLADQRGPGRHRHDPARHRAAAARPAQKFVVGSYSQGASVTGIAIGNYTPLGRGETVPAELSDRIVAVVAFGNPLGLPGRTIADSSETYGSRAVEFCNPGDTVCGGTGTGPGASHFSYPSDGSTRRAAEFVAEQAGGATSDG